MFRFTVLYLFVIIIFSGCENSNSLYQPPISATGTPSIVGDIVDTESWYSDANDSVLKMYITIPYPNSSLCVPYDDLTALPRPCTLEDIDNDRDPGDNYKPELNVLMSTDNFVASAENATFKIRGDYSRTLLQKSYAIKLFSKTDLLEKERKFQLNKHQSDRSRVKNKLAFDLFRKIPHITSLKTKFVDLEMDGFSYGLFTHVESIRKEYLVNRGWNENDNLYNAVDCMFEQRDELAVNSLGVPLNQDVFNKVLEVKNGTNHLKVNEMLEAVELTLDIDQVIAKYFDRDNYITWLAINLVLNNKDTTYHNFYLYNPLYSDKFYFLPWDYDGAWSKREYLGKNEYGISVWWGSPLHKKFFSIKKNRDDVYAMADYLRANYITDAIIQERLDSYESNIRYFMSIYPDKLKNSDSAWELAKNDLIPGIKYNIDLYKSVIGHPMPFRQYTSYVNGILNISWDESIDFEGDKIIYDLNMSSDSNFTNNLIQKVDLNTTFYNESISLNPGIYYLKVLAKEENNASHNQISFNQAYDEVTKYGVLKFEVK